MKITPDQFNRAFAEFQVFGPRRRISIEKRWREIFPDADFEELFNLKSQFERIEEFALKLAEQVKENLIANSVAKKNSLRSIRFYLLNA